MTSDRDDSADIGALRAVTTAAAEIFTGPPRRSSASSYLRHRGIDATALSLDWSLGYAPPGWTHLLDTLSGQFSDDALLAAGLARRSSRGTLIDTFRDRVIFPIRQLDGQVAGFIGRDLSGSSHAPKYLNTARTALFDKSALLYGLWEGRANDPAARQPVVVEGPLDVLAVAARQTADVGGTLMPVAACGTAFTTSHARQLARACPDGQRAVVAMDGDAAGRSAATTTGDLLRHAGLDVRVAVLPNGVDPADLLAHHDSTAAFTFAAALPLLTVHVERAIAAQGDRMQWVEGRLAAGRAIASYLATYPADVAARQISWISDAVQLHPTTFTTELAGAFRTSLHGRDPQPPVVGNPVVALSR